MKSINNRPALFISTLLVAHKVLAVPALGIEEVLVTAQKREQTVQEAPLAISAFNRATLENRGIQSLNDLEQASPLLQVPVFPTTNNSPSLFIRGLGNGDSHILTKDNTVGLYFDGVYIGRTTGMLADLLDIERIEILRGPQGTLYGRNTTGGAINFISVKPAGEFKGQQTLGFGNYAYRRMLTQLDLPETKGLFVKLSYLHSGRDGWVENSGANKIAGQDYEDYYKSEQEGARLALSWQLNGQLSADYVADYSAMETTSPYFQFNNKTGFGGLPSLTDFTDRLQDTKNPLTGDRFAYFLPESDTLVKGHALRVTWQLNDKLTFKSISAYREFDDDVSQNFANALGPFAGTLDVHTLTDDEQFTQELQLTHSSPAWYYVGGIFYLKEQGTQTDSQFVDREALELPAAVSPQRAMNSLHLGTSHIDSEISSYAVYSQASWSPPVMGYQLELSGGLRYSLDKRQATRRSDPASPSIQFSPGENDDDYRHVDTSLSATYHWTDSLSSYFRYATGFRSGGSSPRSPDFSVTFDEEELQSFEVGVKSLWMANRLSLNATVFTTKYDDLILGFVPDPINAPQVIVTVNSGKADINGFELELAAKPVVDLLIGFIYTYLNSRIDDTVSPFDGRSADELFELNWAPEHAYAVAVDYQFSQRGYGIWSLHADYSWRDEQFVVSNTATGEIKVDDYGVTNVKLMLHDVVVGRSRWAVSLWAKNLEDEQQVSYSISNSAFAYITPRTYGVDVSVEF